MVCTEELAVAGFEVGKGALQQRRGTSRRRWRRQGMALSVEPLEGNDAQLAPPEDRSWASDLQNRKMIAVCVV